MTAWEKYELKKEIRKESGSGCLGGLAILICMAIIIYSSAAFIKATDLRLKRLEKAAGISSPASPFTEP